MPFFGDAVKPAEDEMYVLHKKRMQIVMAYDVDKFISNTWSRINKRVVVDGDEDCPQPAKKRGLTATSDIQIASTVSSNTTTELHDQPQASTVIPPMPASNVQVATSAQLSGSEVELPMSPRTSNLLEDLLTLHRICKERKAKLLAMRGSDERLVKIAARKRQLEIRQAQQVERKQHLLIELAELELSIEDTSRDIVGAEEEYSNEGALTNLCRLEVDEMNNSVKALQEQLKNQIDDMGT
ncbi:uncharacterized protein [Leptinotarsa decemlineata]|uniref:uncharacterized protein n=1 Tax=Leptinotarsa decemlineata TaxID=7539 RepID=UPI003D30BFE6